MFEVAIGFILGCVFTYFSLYRPSMKLCEEYQEKLKSRLKER
jgi:hypothetical protein